MEGCVAVLGVGVALVAFITVMVILRGFVLSYLWQWFLVPLGIPGIGLVHAIGISIIITYLTHEKNAYQGPKDEAMTRLMTNLLTPFMALLFGYIVTLFM